MSMNEIYEQAIAEARERIKERADYPLGSGDDGLDQWRADREQDEYDRMEVEQLLAREER